MSNQDPLFQDFPNVTKKEWLEKVVKDLKGKPLESLHWRIDGIELTPFFHQDDLVDQNYGGQEMRELNEWEIGEYIDATSAKQANQDALEGLMGGAEALIFRLDNPFQDIDLAQLFNKIELSFISTHFQGKDIDMDPLGFLERLYNFLKNTDQDSKNIRFSIDFDPIGKELNTSPGDWVDILTFVREKLPQAQVIHIDGRGEFKSADQTVSELTELLLKSERYLTQLSDEGIELAQAVKLLKISLNIGSNYFVDLAKIRAFKILWGNLLKAYSIETPTEPFIEAHFAVSVQSEDSNTNLIKAATQAMSAALGGAQRVFVLPANKHTGETSSPFYRRMARNVQHLMKMESYLNRVVDPAAGSYYVEELTRQLVKNSWAKFQKKMGGE